ncbi:c-type cytochrome [Thiolapillus sp.]
MKIRIMFFLVLPAAALLSACSDSDQNPTGKMPAMPASTIHKGMQPAPGPVERWYDDAQVARGELLFPQNCAECHKADASGDPDWKQLNAEGKLPPPPLNGTAHAWHHPMPLLQQIVRRGGIPMGGSMPAFGDKLSNEQINDILAWVQSHWPDPIYARWHQMTVQAAKRNKG